MAGSESAKTVLMRLAGLALAAGALAAVLARRRKQAERDAADARLDETLAESFPASDPPEAGAPGI